MTGEIEINWGSVGTVVVLVVVTLITLLALIWGLTRTNPEVTDKQLGEFLCGMRGGIVSNYPGGNKVECDITLESDVYNITRTDHYTFDPVKVKELYEQNKTGGK
jgi:hypothetical protein